MHNVEAVSGRLPIGDMSPIPPRRNGFYDRARHPKFFCNVAMPLFRAAAELNQTYRALVQSRLTVPRASVVDVATLSISIKNVVARRPNEQVVRIDAKRVVAPMAYAHPGRDLSAMSEVGKSMSGVFFEVDLDAPIAVVIDTSDPQPATTIRLRDRVNFNARRA